MNSIYYHVYSIHRCYKCYHSMFPIFVPSSFPVRRVHRGRLRAPQLALPLRAAPRQRAARAAAGPAATAGGTTPLRGRGTGEDPKRAPGGSFQGARKKGRFTLAKMWIYVDLYGTYAENEMNLNIFLGRFLI